MIDQCTECGKRPRAFGGCVLEYSITSSRTEVYCYRLKCVFIQLEAWIGDSVIMSFKRVVLWLLWARDLQFPRTIFCLRVQWSVVNAINPRIIRFATVRALLFGPGGCRIIIIQYVHILSGESVFQTLLTYQSLSFFYRYVETVPKLAEEGPIGDGNRAERIHRSYDCTGQAEAGGRLSLEGVFREELTEVASRKRGRKRREAQGEQREKEERSLISKSRIL